MPKTRFILTAVVFSAFAALGGQALAQEVSSDPAAAEGGVYKLDKKHASVTLKLSHLGLSFYTMRFDAVDASYVYDPQSPAAAKLQVTIRADSIDTGNPGFNAEIASQFFEAEKFPTISFVSSAVRPGEGGKGEVVGELTFHGVSRPVTLDVVYNGAGRGLLREERMGFSALTTIRRSDFGVLKLLSQVGDDVTVLIEVEFAKS